MATTKGASTVERRCKCQKGMHQQTCIYVTRNGSGLCSSCERNQTIRGCYQH